MQIDEVYSNPCITHCTKLFSPRDTLVRALPGSLVSRPPWCQDSHLTCVIVVHSTTRPGNNPAIIKYQQYYLLDRKTLSSQALEDQEDQNKQICTCKVQYLPYFRMIKGASHLQGQADLLTNHWETIHVLIVTFDPSPYKNCLRKQK